MGNCGQPRKNVAISGGRQDRRLTSPQADSVTEDGQMGFNVATLSRVPLDLFNHYIFVVGDPRINGHAKWIKRNFTAIVESLPAKTAIVSGTNQTLSREIEKIISDWGGAWQDDDPAGSHLFTLLADGTTLVISRGDIRTTSQPLILVPLSLAGIMDGVEGDDAALEEFMERVFRSVCDAIREGKLDELVTSLGAAHVPLKPLRAGILLTTLKRANEVLDLKPNLLGFGININAIVDSWLKDVQAAR
jgi:hypothetical protein